MEQPQRPDSLAFGLLVFLAELAMLAVLAWSGARLGAPHLPAAIVLAICLPLVAAVLWGLWLAPRAKRRLGNPARLIIKLVLFAAAGALLALSGLLVQAIVFCVLCGAIVAWGERSGASSA